MRRDTTPSSDALEQRIKEVSASCVALAEAKREELLVSVGISEELATAMVATLELDGADPVARARLFEELVPAVRLSGGVAMFRLVHATAGAPVSRDVFLGASALFVLPIDGRRVHHELGHALDAARDDVHAAALALRDRRVLAKTSFTMNDLNVVHELSRLAGPRAQARLLERMIALGEIPPLVDGDSLRRVFEGLDVDVAIAALEERDFSTLRVYEEWETALPVLGEPYVGKEYPDNSEVMSLGFQELGSAEHLTQGLVADDELVCFAVGALLTKA